MKWLLSISLVIIFSGLCCQTDRAAPSAGAPKRSSGASSGSPLTGYQPYRRYPFITRAFPSPKDKVYNDLSEYIPYPIREELPLYPSACLERHLSYTERRKCAFRELLSVIHDQLQYPQAALHSAIEGQVIVGFTVDVDGHLQSFKIIRDIGGGCGAEALRVVKNLPRRWVPGRRDDEPAAMTFVLPVRFELQQ